MMYGNHMTTAWWIFASLGGLIVLGLVLWTLYSILSKLLNRDATHSSFTTASELLDRRLAAGEIDPDEYEQIRPALPRPHDVSLQRASRHHRQTATADSRASVNLKEEAR